MPFPAAPFGPVAGAVVLALLSTLGYASSTVLSIAPHGAPPPHLSSTAILSTAAVVTVLAVDRAGGLGALGLLATAAGIGALTRPHPPRGIVTATPAAEEFEVAHVVR